MFEQTKDGLNIEIIDQDGRSMFPEGGKEPHERTRRLIQKLAEQLKALPNRITITGHTSATQRAAALGLRRRGSSPPTAPTRCAASSSRKACRPAACSWWPASADTQPLFPDDPYIAANRRITITLMREAPPLPPGFTALTRRGRRFAANRCEAGDNSALPQADIRIAIASLDPCCTAIDAVL